MDENLKILYRSQFQNVKPSHQPRDFFWLRPAIKENYTFNRIWAFFLLFSVVINNLQTVALKNGDRLLYCYMLIIIRHGTVQNKVSLVHRFFIVCSSKNFCMPCFLKFQF